MKQKTKTKNQITLTPTEVMEKNASQIVIRKEVTMEDGRKLPTKYATLHNGMIFSTGGRLIGEAKFKEFYASPTNGRKALMTEEQATALYGEMSDRYQKYGKTSLKATIQSIDEGSRKITRVFWNFAKGTNYFETKVTNDNQKIIDVAGEITEVDGEPIKKETALGIARQLLAKTGTISK